MANRRLREEMFDTARGLHDLGLVGAESLLQFDASRLPALKLLNRVERKGLKALA
jgi:hypothetical protein